MTIFLKKTTSIFSCISPLFYVAKIWGYAPFGLTKYGTTDTTCLDYIWSAITFSIHLYVMSVNFSLGVHNYHSDSYTLNIGLEFLESGLLTVACLYLLLSYFTKGNIRTTFDMLDTCDKEVVTIYFVFFFN